ncbi:hypothetical protein Taro_007331 [Colocasia esculenta]|uniref:Uncharacterized protein n=1 Tax=Colocasia esculenta TaxID=4460 RepID=A0A843U3J5_COLES|nr:hypothetical protein [Colocasia esculenta]
MTRPAFGCPLGSLRWRTGHAGSCLFSRDHVGGNLDIRFGPCPLGTFLAPGTNIFCKGSVDTTILGVYTMVQNKGRNVKKSPSQVDTSPEQVDTREPSQKACCSDSPSRSTPNAGRSTLETSPRDLFCQSGRVCRHTSWAGRHTLKSM